MKKIKGVSMGFLSAFGCYMIEIIVLTYYSIFVFKDTFFSILSLFVLFTTGFLFPLVYKRSLSIEEKREVITE